MTTNTCSIPVQFPEDNLVGGVCNVAGLESPCYPLGCPTGQVPVTDEAGTCTTGFCCASPTCAVPNQLCGGGTTCVDTETDVTNCGFCGTQCPGGLGVQCAGGQCQCADGTPVVAQATVPALRQGTQKAGKQSVDSYSLGLPTLNGGTCTATSNSGTVGGCTCSLRYNSYSIPDRFLVRSGGVCTVLKYDTGFTGLVSSGCRASAPCCDKKLGGGCTGTAGGVCPPNTPGISGGGGTGAGIATFTVPFDQPLFVTAYGVSATGGGRARARAPHARRPRPTPLPTLPPPPRCAATPATTSRCCAATGRARASRRATAASGRGDGGRLNGRGRGRHPGVAARASPGAGAGAIASIRRPGRGAGITCGGVYLSERASGLAARRAGLPSAPCAPTGRAGGLPRALVRAYYHVTC